MAIRRSEAPAALADVRAADRFTLIAAGDHQLETSRGFVNAQWDAAN
ncbi:MAG: hypothetical protein ACKO38_20500 [Planctomycetota bacterium]